MSHLVIVLLSAAFLGMLGTGVTAITVMVRDRSPFFPWYLAMVGFGLFGLTVVIAALAVDMWNSPV